MKSDNELTRLMCFDNKNWEYERVREKESDIEKGNKQMPT